MKIVVFGLTVSSSWGNGHATLWRALCKGLAARGHQVVFFEKDVPYYAAQRDLLELPRGKLILYPEWDLVLEQARANAASADVAMVTSYCPDALEASRLVLDSPAPLRVFYDLDTPVTLLSLESGLPAEYIPHNGLKDFDLVLSYTGGRALLDLRKKLGARLVAPIYGSVDPDAHRPVNPRPEFACDMSYLGTYAEDRQTALTRLFIHPAREMSGLRFLIGGAQYPPSFPWEPNIFFVRHVAPADHPAFYCSSRLTLNVTRGAMARMGYCPSGRLFEAAACGTPIISDTWEGLGTFFTPGNEILIADEPEQVIAALKLDKEELSRFGQTARERVLSDHTAVRRAAEMESVFEDALSGELRKSSGYTAAVESL